MADDIGNRMGFPGSRRTLNDDACAVFLFQTTDDLNLIIIKRERKEERIASIGTRLTALAADPRV
jgi:hypothetical protein